MPCGRASAPAPASALFAAEQPARVARPAAGRQLRSIPPVVEKFFAPFVAPAAVSVATNGSALVAPATAVPLFKAHCSFLI